MFVSSYESRVVSYEREGFSYEISGDSDGFSAPHLKGGGKATLPDLS